jgi:hypothetical protein
MAGTRSISSVQNMFLSLGDVSVAGMASDWVNLTVLLANLMVLTAHSETVNSSQV